MKRLLFTFVSLLLVCVLLVLYLPGGFFNNGNGGTPVTRTGVLNLYGTDPYTLDPAVIGDANSYYYALQIFSGLLKLDENLEPVPDIARDWNISQDGKTYTFYLRDDVYFHSGKKLMAQDIKYSWERACNPATGSQMADNILGDIAGVAAVLNGERDDISGVEVVNDYELKVTLDEPKSYFLSKLTCATAFVVNEDNIKSGSDWWLQPDGTGPFILKQWDENSLLVLESYDYYDLTSSFAGVKTVNFHLWAGWPMDLYETGQIDVAGVGIGYIDRITDPAGDFADELYVYPELSLIYLGFNCSQPPFDDANIRLAFSMAIDKDKIVSLTYRDAVTGADGILPEGMPGFNEELDGIEYDVERALEIIAESEYGDVSNLSPITITTSGWGGDIESGLQAVINEWRVNLGVEVEVRQLEPEVYLYELMQEKDEMFYWGWSADYPHPQDFLEVLFGSGAEYNIGEYNNVEVDSLLQAANSELDKEASLELYRQAEQILVDEAACIPLWYSQSYVLVKPYVIGYNLNLLGYTRLNEVAVTVE